jgi:hypothetical protein
MNLIDEKIKEVGKFIGVISFNKGTDNYNKLEKVLLDMYKAGEEGVPLDDETIDEIINDEEYPLNHD